MPLRISQLALIATAMLLPATVLAADLGDSHSGSVKDAPVYALPYSWTGIYLGLHAGYGWGESSFRDGGTKIDNPPYGAFSCGPALTGNYCGTPFELDGSGWLGGVQLGANWQRGGLVLGVEGDLGYLGVKDDDVLIRPFDDRDFASVEYGLYGTVTGRIGFAFDRSLIYFKGGLAVTQVDTEAADLDFQNGDFEIYEGSHVRSSDTLAGWTIGGGVELALSERLSLKAEYLYMDFGSDKSVSADGDIYEIDHQLHTAKIGLNYRLTSDAQPLK